MNKFVKYFNIISLLLQFLTFASTTVLPHPDESIDKSIKEVLDTVVPIFKVYQFGNGIFQCNGILIHPQGVLSTKACIRDFSSQLYAVSLYKWENNLATINRTQLHSVDYFLYSFAYFGFLKIDNLHPNPRSGYEEFVNIKTPVLLVLKKAITSVTPIDFSLSFTPEDMYNKAMPRKCFHFKIFPSTLSQSEGNTIISYELVPNGEVVSPSMMEDIYNSSVYEKYMKELENNNNITIKYLNDSSIFVTHPKINNKNDITYSLGSPLVCKNVDLSRFTLTGILIDTLQKYPTYFGINGNWTFQKLNHLNKNSQYKVKLSNLPRP